MAPKKEKPPHCQVCKTNDSKYTCSQCYIAYCSVPCYKEHKANACHLQVDGKEADAVIETEKEIPSDEQPLSDPVVLRPLTSLKSLPTPILLKRDDPKVLQLQQYEAIATSPAIRRILQSKKNLPELLRSIDNLRGRDREEALQKALGVTPADIQQLQPKELDEEVLALRELAEAIEAAVRGDNTQALGLNWGD
ncbi:hypothetical protein DFP72DRAFT_1140774 [Ephemerocybe angulata]|uniref:HIT-type domain-containing protein n=1 Tax=Ephemerocybe angulata TaxID=980116 RepID=A0A8H6IDR0_9AGAR|nr:hypothetical protein DFP72DRAFT_1140774 [Tulosesus angulatus]